MGSRVPRRPGRIGAGRRTTAPRRAPTAARGRPREAPAPPVAPRPPPRRGPRAANHGGAGV